MKLRGISEDGIHRLARVVAQDNSYDEDDYAKLEKDPIEYNRNIDIHVKNIFGKIFREASEKSIPEYFSFVFGDEIKYEGTKKFKSTVYNAVMDLMNEFRGQLEEL